MRKILSAAVLGGLALISAEARADVPGFYMGAQFGYTQLNYTRQDFNASYANITQGSVGGRASLGYQFNKYFSAETGYTYFGNLKVSNMTVGNKTGIGGSVQEYSYDLMGKAEYPLQDSGFDIFAKMGIAFTYMSTSTTISTYTPIDSQTKAQFAFGGGFNYNLMPHVPVSISWVRFQRNGNIENSDLASIGLSYYFG